MLSSKVRKVVDVLRRGARAQAKEIDDEIAFHVQERTDALLDRGWTPEEAKAEALRRFGDLKTERPALFAAARHRDRSLDVFEWFDAVRTDLRVAARQVRRAPTFAIGVIAAFALGVGANATMFSVIDRLLLRPPAHVASPGDVYAIHAPPRDAISFPAFVDLRNKLAGVAGIAVQTTGRQLAIGRGDEATMVQGVFVDGGYFRTLGVRPVAGRLLSDDDAKLPDGQPVAVIGFGLWQRQFGADPAVVGRDLIVSSTHVRIIGVAPPGFNGIGTRPLDLWMPVTLASALLPAGSQWPWAIADNAWLNAIARLSPGADPRSVGTRATALLRAAALARASRDTSISIELQSILPARAGALSPEARIAALLGAVSLLVLLLACANASNLMLARTIRRRREIAIRLALGVSRGRLMAGLVLDALLLAALGGVVAIAVAAAGGALMRDVLLDGFVWNGGLVDGWTLGFVAIITLVAGLVTGLLPGLALLRRFDLSGAISEGRQSGGIHRSRFISSLVVAQTVFSCVLLIGALLFVRSLTNVRRVPLGMDLEHAVAVSLDTKVLRTASSRADGLFADIGSAVGRVPGVVSIATAEGIPFSQWYLSTKISVSGRAPDSPEIQRGAFIRAVSGAYFATIGTRIVRGRAFVVADDRASGEQIAIVSADMAKALWPDVDPIGRCVRLGADSMPCRRIIGVAEATQESAIGPNDSSSPYAAIVYVPISQGRHTVGARTLIARIDARPGEAIGQIRRAVQQVDPTMPLADVWLMQSRHDPEIRPWRLGATMFGVFGALALVVAALGLYSVIAYSVAQRSGEMGIRIALGARGRDIVSLVGSQGARLAGVGIVIAVAGAASIAPLVQPLLFQVSARSPGTYVAAGVVMIVVAIAASLVPATRAAHVSPMRVIRSE